MILGAALLLPTASLPAQWSLTVLHNNDGESQLVDAGDGVEDFGGVARFKTAVDEARTFFEGLGHGVLTISSGDNFLAGQEFAVSQNNVENGGSYFDALALDAIGYDAVILGNHDFDFGPSLLADFIQDTSGIPFLSANLDFSGDASLSPLTSGPGQRIFKSTVSTVNTASGMKSVGIVGATTENLSFISSPGLVSVGDVLSSVQAEVDFLRNTLGVDKVILASHLQAVDEEIDLIGQLTGVDVVIAGGGDEILANNDLSLVPGDSIDEPYPIRTATDLDGNFVPVVTTGGNYKYLGRLSVEFDADGNLVSAFGEPLRIVDEGSTRKAPGESGFAADAGLQSSVVDPVAAGLQELDNNLIAQAAFALTGSRNNHRARENNTGNLLADALLQVALNEGDSFGLDIDPDRIVGMVNGGGIRNESDITDSDGLGGTDDGISEGDTFEIAPFSNFVAVVEDITMEELKLFLENAISKTVLEDGQVVRQGDGTGRFAQVSMGFEFVYDVTAQALELENDGTIKVEGQRVLSAVLPDGTVVDFTADTLPEITLDIVTTNFSAGGGDQWFFFREEKNFVTLGATYQQALEAFITGELGGIIDSNSNGGAYVPGGVGRITAVPEPGTIALMLVGLAGGALLIARRRSRS